MDAKTQDLFNRFTYHPPSPAAIHALREIRAMALEFADQMVREVPSGREQALALTKLEEVVMWANAGIVRNQTETDREDGVVMEATPPAKSHEEALRDYADHPLEPVEPKLWKRRVRDRGKPVKQEESTRIDAATGRAFVAHVQGWAAECGRWHVPPDVLSDTTTDDTLRLSFEIRTGQAIYRISAHPPSSTRPEGYLGCIAGVHDGGGNDLPDGPCTDETWHRILAGIVGYECALYQREGV